MAEAVLTEAPLKRKADASSEAGECKKSRDDGSALEPISGNWQAVSAQSNGGQQTHGDNEAIEKPSANHGSSSKTCETKLSTQAPGSSSAPLQELDTVGEGEVIERDKADEEDDCGELSGLDTENNSEEEEEDEDDSDDDEDDSDEESDDEEGGEHRLTTTSSSLQGEDAHKGKGKAKMDDLKGKRVMPLDKGKGKAIVEDETAAVSDEEDAGYLSEDPLEEVDLNNILPTRTRRGSSTHHYDFVDQGDDDNDDDDSDA